MNHKFFVAFSAGVFNLALAIAIVAYCASTWTTQPPTFGPQLGFNGCTARNELITETSKSVSTTINWSVGPPETHVITDSGQNRVVAGKCARCFPIFNEGKNILDSADVFSALRLWQDTNHNGLSEPGELHTLSSLNVAALELDYKYSKKTDANGNQFGFAPKSRARMVNNQDDGPGTST